MKLIETWKHAYKYVSVQLTALLVLLSFAYDYLPAIQTYFPSMWVQGISMLILVARVIQQKKLATPVKA